MVIIAEEFEFVVGVDTHARTQLSPLFMPQPVQWSTPPCSRPPLPEWTLRSTGSGGAQAGRGSSQPSRARPPTVPGSPRSCLPLTSTWARLDHLPAHRGPSPASRIRSTRKPQPVQSWGDRAIR